MEYLFVFMTFHMKSIIFETEKTLFLTNYALAFAWISEYRHGIICENCLKFMTFLKKIKYLRNRRNLCIFIYIIYSMFLLDSIKHICFVFYDVYQRNPGSFETKKTIVNSCYFYFSYMLTCILYDILWSISCEA